MALVVRHLDRVPYGEALKLQRELREARLAGRIPDTILLLEHPDVITFGRGSRPGHTRLSELELVQAGYEVYHVERGGDVTYHGPGQLVGYPILDLGRHGADLHAYLRALEQVLIAALAELGVEARRREGYAGVWLDERRKIASIGVGVRRWVTTHGFAINVCCDLRRFDPIVACGLRGVEMTSVSAVLGREVEVDRVRPLVDARLAERFG